MSKYNNYGLFMIAVLEETGKKAMMRGRGNLYSLLGLYGASVKIIPIINTVLGLGWTAFKATCALLILGPIAFAVTLASFIAGGIGVAVITALAVYGGIRAIRLLYSNRITVLTIYEVGKRYKERFDNHINECSYIDNLIDEASDNLIQSV